MNLCLKCQKKLSADEAVYGLHRYCFINWFGEGQDLAFKEVDPKQSMTGGVQASPEIKKQNNTFFHGRYQKYSARLHGVSYILKVQEKEYPELPIMEYVCNQIASLLKIEVPPYFLIDFNGRLTFVTRNFMQDYTGQLDHLYKYLPKGEEHHNCEEIIGVILKETQHLSDVIRFIEICLYDIFIGNNDRHGRNLGIIVTASGKKLAPMYDNPSCLGVEEEYFLVSDISPSGSIWTKSSKHPKVKEYIEEFLRLGYRKYVQLITKNIIMQSNNISSTIKNSMLSEKRKDALLRLVEKRIQDFKDEYK